MSDTEASSSKRSPRMGRRTFLKTVGVTAGAAAGVSYTDGTSLDPVGEADAVVPLVLAGVALAGAAGVGYLGGSYLEDKYLGDSRDYSGYTGITALKTELAAGIAEMRSADERVMTSIQNNITNSKNIALSKGKAAVVKEMNAGNGESAATTAMQDAIDKYYSDILENILTHCEAQRKQLQHMGQQVDAHADGSVAGAFDHWKPSADGVYDINMAPTFMQTGSDSYFNEKSKTVTLLDGREATVWYCYANGGSTSYDFWYGPAWRWIPDDNIVGSSSKTTYPVLVSGSDWPQQEAVDPAKYDAAVEAVYTERDDVNATLSTFVSDVYSQYSAGDIPTEEIVDPITAATELRTNYDGMQSASAHAAMMGIPTNAEQSVYMTLEDDGVDVWADVYTNKKITDGSGNEVGFQAGTTYDPTTWSEPLYIAFEYTETTDSDGNVLNSTQQESYDGETTTTEYSDFVEVEQPFTITEITVDGESKQSFKTTSRNTQTADVSKLQEELNQIRETQLALQEESQSGGGGFSLDSLSIGGIPGEGVALIGGGIAAWLLGSN